ncbi:kelch domain-containing protein 3-like isoform X2 [Tetranychus urticae]|uniref:Kelch domain-containing protein 3 n=1 Tax=Tetranychus urticae TaxID=32264 RepID=T1KHK1_TETUR|nr:kelch domain-containing protein 3-like isoform X2 [Tetranychus urticae]
MLVVTRIGGGLKRVNHAAVAVDELIYSFGGFAFTEDNISMRPIDVHTLNMNTLRWEQISYSDGGDPTNVPFIRYGHSVVAQDDIIYLWGGRRDRVQCNKMFTFDTNTRQWSAPKVKGTIPRARGGHAACICAGHMYILGGYEEATKKYCDTVFRFELKTFTWQAVYQLTSGLLKKVYMSCVAIDNKIYLFGGRSYSCPFRDSDIMELDTEKMTLSTPKVSGYKPCCRRSHSAVVIDNKMVVFGGYNDITDEYHNDFNVFDPKTYSWTPLNTIGQEPPRARRGNCCVAVNSFLYLFGGSSPEPKTREDQAASLMELDDLFVIDTNRSLRSMSLQVVLKNDLDTRRLPPTLRREVESYRTDNKLQCTQLNAQ